MMFARLSSPKICSRNLSGMRWRRAISATPSGQSRSLRASSISALTAYLLFCVSLKTDHPINKNIQPVKIVADIRKRQPPNSALWRVPGAAGSSGLRLVDGLFHLPGVGPDLFLQLLLGPFGGLVDGAFDGRLPHHYERGFAVVQQLTDLPDVLARHAPFEVADEGSGPGPDKAAKKDSRRKEEAERRPDRRACPAAVLGRLLYFVDYLDLAFFILGHYRGVVGADDVLAV